MISVHCRTGSLEMFVVSTASAWTVHCRTGSLEKITTLKYKLLPDTANKVIALCLKQAEASSHRWSATIAPQAPPHLLQRFL